jgi:hypothetical protein
VADAPAKTKRSKVCAYFYREEGFLVRGTLDPMEALKLALAVDSEHRIGGYWMDVIVAERHGEPFPQRPDGDPAEWVRVFGDHLHAVLKTARPGLYRIIPVGPNHHLADDGYAWLSRRVDECGPGVFEGVEFQ